ncbi:hypothetical protein [Helicobacter fennelliae]|uniref:Uncharacterized protein n=1 Tax=Helicobacter fennelliae MRY12-0050 TaxID=1325130 RepID=T1CNP7_9HELI|nr:hypothetical protein [Helicobacter fennelliae]GAD18404.1 hypothetical protein HFN_2332 [Helicobacter fennelliae MRY12-0050]STP14366.1 Uncharacterised protein [Helicobacter fennelliae]
MTKKITIFGLILGGIIIVVLCGVLFFGSYLLKKNIQTTLDSYAQELQHSIPNLKIAPFSCSGFTSITCQSPQITFSHYIELQDFEMNIQNLHSSNKLDFSFQSKLALFNNQNSQKTTNINTLLNMFLISMSPNLNPSTLITPNAFKCTINNEFANQIIHNITQCNFTAPHIQYLLQARTAQNLNTNLKQLKDVILESYELYMQNPQEFKNNFKLQFDSARLTLTPQNLKESIFEQIKSQDTNFTPDLYAKSIEFSKNIALYMLGISFNRSAFPFKQEILQSIDGIANMLNAQNNGIEYTLSNTSGQFISLLELESMLEKYNLSNLSLQYKELHKEPKEPHNEPRAAQ